MADQPQQNNHRIDPDGWYTERDVVLLLDVGRHVQERERDAGRLGFNSVGGVPVYRGQHLLDWLNGKPDGPSAAGGKGQQPPRPTGGRTVIHSTGSAFAAPETPARATAAPISSASPGSPHSTIGEAMSAKAEFDKAVEAKVKAGQSRESAVAAVVREQPDLQRRVIDEANATRGQQLRGRRF